MAGFYQTWGPRRSLWHFNVARYSKALSEPVAIEVRQPSVDIVPVQPEESKPHFKRVDLRQVDFDKFGYSAGCKACTYLRTGYDRQGVAHTEECGMRVIQRLQETEYGRKGIDIARKREEDAKQEVERKKTKTTVESSEMEDVADHRVDPESNVKLKIPHKILG